MIDVVIVGAGGFGREVYMWAKDVLPATTHRIKGFLAKTATVPRDGVLPIPILGDEQTYEIEAQDRFLFAIGDVTTKVRIINHLKQRGAKFLSLVHQTAVVSETAHIGEGTIVCPYVIVADNVVLEDFVTMNFFSSCGHDVKIGKFCILSPYAIVGGGSTLEEGTFMGMHATVAPGRKIGAYSRISSNSAAMDHTPPYSLVVGVMGNHRRIYEPT